MNTILQFAIKTLNIKDPLNFDSNKTIINLALHIDLYKSNI